MTAASLISTEKIRYILNYKSYRNSWSWHILNCHKQWPHRSVWGGIGSALVTRLTFSVASEECCLLHPTLWLSRREILNVENGDPVIFSIYDVSCCSFVPSQRHLTLFSTVFAIRYQVWSTLPKIVAEVAIGVFLFLARKTERFGSLTVKGN